MCVSICLVHFGYNFKLKKTRKGHALSGFGEGVSAERTIAEAHLRMAKAIANAFCLKSLGAFFIVPATVIHGIV